MDDQTYNYRVTRHGGPGSLFEDFDNLSVALTEVGAAIAEPDVHFVALAKVAPMPVITDEDGTRTREPVI